jgi:polyphosphate glucokinase
MGSMGIMLTLAIDCGGTGIKGSVLDDEGRMIAKRIRVKTPYPLPPARFVGVLEELSHRLPAAQRATVGMPGMIRHGTVVATPHYITKRGPHSTVDPDLERAWRGFDVKQALEAALQLPTLVLNDAEVAGAGAVSGYGFEVMFTLGTGLGNAIFDNGVLLPHLEISRSPVRRGRLYDDYIGDKARKRVGQTAWSLRVRDAILGLRPMLQWDHLFLGGGNAVKVLDRHLAAIGPRVTVVSNDVGIIGGVKAWEVSHLRGTPAKGLPEPPDTAADLQRLIDALIEPGEDPDIAAPAPAGDTPTSR